MHAAESTCAGAVLALSCKVSGIFNQRNSKTGSRTADQGGQPRGVLDGRFFFETASALFLVTDTFVPDSVVLPLKVYTGRYVGTRVYKISTQLFPRVSSKEDFDRGKGGLRSTQSLKQRSSPRHGFWARWEGAGLCHRLALSLHASESGERFGDIRAVSLVSIPGLGTEEGWRQRGGESGGPPLQRPKWHLVQEKCALTCDFEGVEQLRRSQATHGRQTATLVCLGVWCVHDL